MEGCLSSLQMVVRIVTAKRTAVTDNVCKSEWWGHKPVWSRQGDKNLFCDGVAQMHEAYLCRIESRAQQACHMPHVAVQQVWHAV